MIEPTIPNKPGIQTRWQGGYITSPPLMPMTWP
jgi:hypothetical protein